MWRGLHFATRPPRRQRGASVPPSKARKDVAAARPCPEFHVLEASSPASHVNGIGRGPSYEASPLMEGSVGGFVINGGCWRTLAFDALCSRKAPAGCGADACPALLDFPAPQPGESKTLVHLYLPFSSSSF